MTLTRDAVPRALPVLEPETKPDTEPLPELYQRWLGELLSGALPRESKATCSDCAMCNREPRLRGPMSSDFDTVVKCCTYMPTLPNFLVGMILGDESVERHGIDSIRRRIADRVNATPLGLIMQPSYRVLYDLGQQATFGHSQAMRCPHYVSEGGGRCGIWKYRNSVCSTWFCKYERGASGRKVWKHVRELLTAVETELSLSCAVHFGIDAEVALGLVKSATATDAEAVKRELLPDAALAAARRHWGRWFGREDEFYRACASRVAAMSWSDVAAICGATVHAKATLARDDYRRTQDARLPARLPARLRMAQAARWRYEGDTYCVAGYSTSDPLLLSQAVLDALAHFDGTRSTEETRRRVLVREGIELDPALLLQLVDFGVLTAATSDEESQNGRHP
jgi:hypothetical protein